MSILSRLTGNRKANKKVKHGDAIDRLYDSFAVKDMSRAAFRRGYMLATSPRLAERDLKRILFSRGRAKSKKERIEDATKD